MPTTAARPRTAVALSPVRRALRLATAVAAAAAAVVGLTSLAPSASAYSLPSGIGPIGQITLNAGGMIEGYGDGVLTADGGFEVVSRGIGTAGVSVTRSPATTEAQVVEVRYFLTRTDGTQSMSIGPVERRTTTITHAYPVQLLGAMFDDVPQDDAVATYRVDIKITWFDQTDAGLAGDVLATTWVSPSSSSENQCRTTSLPCVASADGITL